MRLHPLTTSLVVQRRLLAAATGLVPFAVLVSLPMAFGILMTPVDDGPDAPLADPGNPLLQVLFWTVATAVVGLCAGWVVAGTDLRTHRRTPVVTGLAALSAAAAALILGTFALEMLTP